MTNDTGRDLNDLRLRIGELNNKCTQMLLFLSFAIVAGATLSGSQLVAGDRTLVRSAMWWWMSAVFPVLVGVLPLKDARPVGPSWYSQIRWSKFGVLWLAVILSAIGVVQFMRAVS